MGLIGFAGGTATRATAVYLGLLLGLLMLKIIKQK